MGSRHRRLAILKAALPLEYVIRFIILLVALTVIAMIILSFQNMSLPPAQDDKPQKPYPIIQKKAKFSREEVARNIADCYQSLSGMKPIGLEGKVCYIMESGKKGDFNFVTEPNIQPLLGPKIPVEYNTSSDSEFLTILFDFTNKKIIVRSTLEFDVTPTVAACAQKGEACIGVQCCKGLACKEGLSGEKACCKPTECPANNACIISGRCSGNKLCSTGSWKASTPNETICDDRMDNDCDGLIDIKDDDCATKLCTVTTTIKEALEKLAGKCPVINVPAGTYREGWIDVPANVHLKGEGESTLIILPANKGCGDYIFRVNADNVTIEGMSLDGDRANQGERVGCEADYGVFVGGERLPLPLPNANNVLVKDMIIKSMAGDGVYVGIAGTITNVTITKSTISNNFRNGISLTNGDKVYVTDNYVDGSSGYWGGGLAIDVEPEIVGRVSNAYIQNNRYKGVIEGSRYCRGRCSNIVVSGNIQQ